MSEIQFESSLTMEQIEENFAGVNIFEGVMDGLEKALACEKGQNEMCEIARKYFTDGEKSGEDRVRFEFFFTMVAEDGLSIDEALVKARVPTERQNQFVEMYYEETKEN